MKIINQRKISVLWHLICFSLVLAFAACSDDKEEFQEYLTPASGSESIFEQGLALVKLLLRRASVLRPGSSGQPS